VLFGADVLLPRYASGHKGSPLPARHLVNGGLPVAFGGRSRFGRAGIATLAMGISSEMDVFSLHRDTEGTGIARKWRHSPKTRFGTIRKIEPHRQA
jgi:hypothetical protein